MPTISTTGIPSAEAFGVIATTASVVIPAISIGTEEFFGVPLIISGVAVAGNVSPDAGPTVVVLSGPPVSSGTVCFLPDILDLAQEAAERAGVDFTSGQALRSARMALDLMSMEWSNEGLNLWQIDSQTLPLMPGVSDYTLPSDTLELIYPCLRIVNQSGNVIDTSMSRIDVTDYAAIPNKGYQGNPQLIWFNRQAIPVVTVWPVPSDNTTASLFYYRFRRIQDTGIPTNNMDIPMRFVPAMVAGLAWRFAQKSRDPMVLQKVPWLKAEYNEAFAKAKYEDRSKTSIFLTPMVRF